MELEQLKNLWPKDTGPKQKQDEYLLSLLSKRSNGPIAQMKRNLFWELIIVIVLYGAGMLHFFTVHEGRMAEIGWLMLAVSLVFFVYYYRKNKLLNKMQCVSCHVKSNLQLQLRTLEKYVRFYLVAGNILFPLVMLIVGYVALVAYPRRMQAPDIVFDSPAFLQQVYFYLTLTLVLSVAVFFLNRWYVNYLYGQHIKKLKQVLGELAEEPA